VILLRAVVRVLAFVVLLALALAGAAVALFSIQGGTTGLSIPSLAELIGLPELGGTLDRFLAGLEGSGAIDALEALAGAGAVLLGALLIAGAVTPARERLLSLDDAEEGALAARRRPLAQLASALAERAEGVTAVKARVRPGRRRGGRVTVVADRTRPSSKRDVCAAIGSALDPLTRPFGLKPKIKTKVAQRGGRVQ
jgi:hypothetical protein